MLLKIWSIDWGPFPHPKPRTILLRNDRFVLQLNRFHFFIWSTDLSILSVRSLFYGHSQSGTMEPKREKKIAATFHLNESEPIVKGNIQFLLFHDIPSLYRLLYNNRILLLDWKKERTSLRIHKLYLLSFQILFSQVQGTNLDLLNRPSIS